MKQKRIYLDYAATTPQSPEVLEVMKPYFEEEFGNPSAIYEHGRKAKLVVDRARKKVARLIGARKSQEIVFTSGGTESCNMAIMGITRANKDKGKHILTSRIEHFAVLCPIRYLQKKEGFTATHIRPDAKGIVHPEFVEKLIKDNTVLVSIIYANNEIGTINSIPEIAKVIKRVKTKREKTKNTTPIYFHTDACQAAGYQDLNVEKLGVDLMTINGGKIYGPKGSGILYIKEGVVIDPIIFGGGQEEDRRSGTENLPGIVGFAKALSLVQNKRKKEAIRVQKLRDYLWKEIQQKIKGVRLNGDPKKRLPNNLNITVYDVEGESVVLYLDEKGVEVSTGSACHAKDLEPSHVLTAIGLPNEEAHGSLRITLGKYTTKADIDYFLKVIPEIVKKLRSVSSLITKDEKSKES